VSQAPALAPTARVEIRELQMTYGSGPTGVHAIRDLELCVADAEFVCVLGPSGSGKSTLLHLIAGLQQPTGGTIRVDGVAVHALALDQAARWRRRHLGVVHQFFNLIPTLSLVQNVALPLLLEGRRLREVRPRVEALLEELGIAGRRDHQLEELSGGELQRVAIARALVAEPGVILADEPTGNLDSRTGAETLATFRRLTRERGTTILLATHDLSATSYADRIVTLRDGCVAEDLRCAG
jgi:putative ABC transport system ATP-binding protein